MNNQDYFYLRFPVQILKCEFGNISKVCSDAIAYGMMDYMERNEYEGIQGLIRTYNDFNMSYGSFKRSDYSDQPKEAINHIEELHYSKCYREKSERYNELKDSIDIKITCSIKKDLLLDFLNNKKSEFEIAVFRFFVALNSIQGISKYGQTTYDRVFAVMFGYNTDKVLEKDGLKMALLTDIEHGIYLKYSTRKIREKITTTLQMDYYLKWYPAGKRGNFYSFKLGRRALATIVETVKSNDRKRKNALIGANKKAKEWAVNELKTNGLYY